VAVAVDLPDHDVESVPFGAGMVMFIFDPQRMPIDEL
jgi:hypothetical protein